ncbi:MAG: hypothetical protein LBJ22_00265 [Synergistaceae bacterium]|jgi:hypothetical protein|nr:hypothetical protein [Synergistaceae bacterium]
MAGKKASGALFQSVAKILLFLLIIGCDFFPAGSPYLLYASSDHADPTSEEDRARATAALLEAINSGSRRRC